jgi:hypothetical protein
LKARQGKRFFFEKKKQKTFPRWSGPAAGATMPAPQAFPRLNACGAGMLCTLFAPSVRSTREKFFASFFQKRSACLASGI